ncbi:class D beta-lactamase [Massilia sp. IC2-477]|uniref:class D beta-lactamase n=1 Tax=Massilia sp. IC2-477 TaxID=2887198 RepID=UPI001D116E3F|nr:class D beta-lactamase [Massilia sp. IC2-477]MCC2954692.1 class D beta-lactamase [Massilia sp. IC2-477]
MHLKPLIMLALVAGAALPAAAQGAIRCTLLVDADSGKTLVRDGQCEQRVTPASTFKVAISLMGYDSGILVDEKTPLLPFREGYVDWLPEWRTATDPAAWMKQSVVWYSQQVTTRLGAGRFQSYIDRFDYGNRDASGNPGKHDGLTEAWLSSSLKISPDEQAVFLRKLVNRTLPVSRKAVEMTASIMRYPMLRNGWELYAKTGSGSEPGALPHGWLVGWATNGTRTVVFARLVQDDKRENGRAGLRVRDAFIRELPKLLEKM